MPSSKAVGWSPATQTPCAQSGKLAHGQVCVWIHVLACYKTGCHSGGGECGSEGRKTLEGDLSPMQLEKPDLRGL